MSTDILARIQAQLHTFSKGQKRIANYILESYDKAAFMTASKLGKTVAVSESTVVRFAVELGFDGYPSMQRSLQEMVRTRLTSVQRIEAANDRFGDQDVVSSVLQSDIDSIRLTAESLDRREMAACVEAILQAKHIYIVGVRSSAALAAYQTTGMRQHIVEKGGVTFVEDCYNASPDSMKAALSVLKALPNARKIALLGDMLELGDASEDGHRHTGEWAADAGVEVVIAYGPRSEAMAQAARERGVTTVHCQTAEEVLQYLRQFVRPGDAVLAKASHAMGLEQLLQDFYKELPQG